MGISNEIPDGLHWYSRKRNLLCLLAFFGYFLVICIQINITIAIVPMTTSTIRNGTIIHKADFSWDSSLQGHVLASFYYGYTAGQIIGGMLAARFGGHIIMATSLCFPAIVTLLMPLSTNLDATGLIIARVIAGLLMSPFFPACNQLWSEWSPPLEQSGYVAFSISGASIGGFILMIGGGVLAERYGWSAIFYVTGVLPLIWTVIWVSIARKSPEFDKFISPKELNYIKEEIKKMEIVKNSDDNKIPWLKIMTSIPVWANLVTQFGCAWSFNTMLNIIPTYMKNVLKFDLEEVGYMSALPHLSFSVFMTISGYIADWVIARELLSISKVRKTWVTLALIFQCIFLLLLFAISNKYGKVACLTLAFASNTVALGSLIVNTLDIHRIYAGVILGVIATAANFSGIVSSIFTGYMLQGDSMAGWLIIIFVICGMSILVSVVFCLFASGKQQDWTTKK